MVGWCNCKSSSNSLPLRSPSFLGISLPSLSLPQLFAWWMWWLTHRPICHLATRSSSCPGAILPTKNRLAIIGTIPCFKSVSRCCNRLLSVWPGSRHACCWIALRSHPVISCRNEYPTIFAWSFFIAFNNFLIFWYFDNCPPVKFVLMSSLH